MSEPQLRLTEPAAPPVLAKRLRTIATGARAALDKGVTRPLLESDVVDLEDAADVLEAIEGGAAVNDTDALAAETRRLLDAATPGPWEVWRGGTKVVAWFAGHGGAHKIITPTLGNAENAALIAAAPRLLANWLAREDRPTREAEWVRAVQYGAKVVKQRDAAIAERDRLADENRALREAIGDPEELRNPGDLRSDANEHQLLNRLRRIAAAAALAAADRGVTDGEAT